MTKLLIPDPVLAEKVLCVGGDLLVAGGRAVAAARDEVVLRGE